MPPSASWAPTSAVRRRLKPTTAKTRRTTTTMTSTIQITASRLSRTGCRHCVGHQEPPPPPPPPPPPENPPPPPLECDWVAWYAEMELATVELKSPTIWFT